jgi:HPt (histidine-containing phosphotransfer) domain-containing protein
MDPAGEPDLTEAMDRLWARFLPQMRERVATLETVAAAVAAGHLSIEERQAACSAAHKLAGVLGAFGLAGGTVLARELEIIYSRENGPGSAHAVRLIEIAAELRAMVENRK